MSLTDPRNGAEAALRSEFRRAWSLFATGVTLITTLEPSGAVHGMTANGVTSVSLSPLLALACIGHERNTHGLIVKSGRFGLSVLSAGQTAVASHYAQPPEKRGAARGFEFVALGQSRVLAGALAAMDCRVVAAHEAGDHTIFVAAVDSITAPGGEPLLWFTGAFGDIRLRAGRS
jgi:flavin reductase (DIM6/NTAB) family NADH-FMN oxidoreductase RutF